MKKLNSCTGYRLEANSYELKAGGWVPRACWRREPESIYQATDGRNHDGRDGGKLQGLDQHDTPRRDSRAISSRFW